MNIINILNSFVRFSLARSQMAVHDCYRCGVDGKEQNDHAFVTQITFKPCLDLKPFNIIDPINQLSTNKDKSRNPYQIMTGKIIESFRLMSFSFSYAAIMRIDMIP